MSKKTLEELVFHDDFMFAAVMMDAENCRCFLERVLEIQIERVEISTEHGFFFNPECKSIRMDVFAKDENRTHYDIEMQLVKKDSLEKRSRYYHSQMDVEMLEKGKSYGALLDFVKADLAGSEADYEDALVKRLQESMRQIKRSRKMGERYMMFEQYMKEYVQEHADEIREEAWAEGLAEGHAEGLQKGRAEGLQEGRAEGLQEGRAEGLQKGRAEATTRLNKLYSCLLTSDRADDLQRALKDPVYLEQLLQEFGF